MSDQPRFTLTVDQNKYLPAGGQRVDAILTVEATGPAEVTAPAADAAEVIIIDASPSMGGDKIVEARQAARTAVDTLRDGVLFAVVSGDRTARMTYPNERKLMPATPATRRQAKDAIGRLEMRGSGTSIGKWLRLAATLLDRHPDAIRHAILLTDGQDNEGDAPFAKALEQCAGRFVCDSLGVGDDWAPAQLRRIANALLGSFDFVRDPEDLAGFFRSLTEHAMGKAVADIALRVWAPQGAAVKTVKQVFPTDLDLTGKRVDVDPRTGDYPTGAWGAEEREYQLTVEIPAGAVHEEIRAARARLVVPDTGEILAQGKVMAHWTEDLALSTQRSAKVDHYTGQQEQNELIQEGLKAYEEGDHDTATARFGHARKLAEASGREHIVRQLDNFVETDPGTGTARLRQGITKADVIDLDTGTDRTARMRPDGQDAAGRGGPGGRGGTGGEDDVGGRR